MRKQLLQSLALGTACCVITAQAQTPGTGAGAQDRPQTSPGTHSPGTYQSQPGQRTTGQSSTELSATGRMGQQQHIKASKLEGAQVTSSSGQQLGTLKDAIINPTSGRIDFAILSVSSTAGATTTPGATTTTPGATTTRPGATTTPGSSLTGGEKQVAVPWMLLRTSGAGSTAATTDTDKDSVNLVFSGDAGKLQNAPSFNESTDMSQSWRQSVYSHYGLTSGAATGGSYTPGGRTIGGESDTTRPDTTRPGSTTDPTDPNRPGSTTNPNQPRSGSSGLGTDRDR